ncbi:MAG: HYR domain-containing protein, partial [Saprospiraceae bacterium]
MQTFHLTAKMFFILFLTLNSHNIFSQGITPKERIIQIPKPSSAPCDKIPKIQCPPYITLCPGSDTDPKGTGCAKGISGGPNCELPIVTYVDRNTSEGPCNGEKLIQRLWTAIDPTDPSLRTFCIQYITLEDKEAPLFVKCNHDTTIQSNEKCFALVTWQTPSVTDQCSNFCVKSSHPNGSIFPVGTTKVIFTATDICGNVSTCGFNIIVVENCCNTAPIITCPHDYIACFSEANPNITGKATAIPGNPKCISPIITYKDDTIFNASCSLRIDRKWLATDPNNLQLNSSCVQKISLSDTEEPTITCPANITVKSDPDCKATVHWTEPTVSDNCSHVTLVSSHPSGSRFEVGTTTVFYTASDACGNSKRCQFTITVVA